METGKRIDRNRTGGGKLTARFLRLVCLVPLLALVGCASSYDCYNCGNVNCGYCPPNPLPYSSYEPSECNNSIGQAYLANLPTDERVESQPNSSATSLHSGYYLRISDQLGDQKR